MGYLSGFLEWSIGVKFWSGSETSILVVEFVLANDRKNGKNP